MCNRKFPDDQLQNSDPRRNHLVQDLKKIAEGSESFQPASHRTEDRIKAYKRHFNFVQEENNRINYTNPSTEEDLKCTFYPNA